VRRALLILLAACSSKPAAPEEEPRRREEREEPTQKDLRDLRASAARPERSLLADAKQLVVATVDDWDDVSAELVRYERVNGAWKQVGEPWQSAIGAKGSAWGRGVHGDGAPAGGEGPVKVEGDGKSPAGAFRLGAAYGYADAPPAGTKTPYQKVDKDWLCIDDRASRHYNKVLDTKGLERDWSSHEDMRRKDDLYRWVLFVDHNPKPEPGAGSCIFLHLWRGPDDGTAGCTAMAPAPMETLLAWLRPTANPTFVLLPADQVAPLRAAWGLP
jgi:L,D-peptidoglycan transpeptidase YkuD (ErfK/YbiS/YcfS/YnhG family)